MINFLNNRPAKQNSVVPASLALTPTNASLKSLGSVTELNTPTALVSGDSPFLHMVDAKSEEDTRERIDGARTLSQVVSRSARDRWHSQTFVDHSRVASSESLRTSPSLNQSPTLFDIVFGESEDVFESI